MSYVIYHRETFKRLRASNGSQSFDEERVAKGVLTRYLNAAARNDARHTFKVTPEKREDYIIAPYNDWCNIVPMVEVESVMGGKVLIRADERGNPACDPSMEGHWTM